MSLEHFAFIFPDGRRHYDYRFYEHKYTLSLFLPYIFTMLWHISAEWLSNVTRIIFSRWVKAKKKNSEEVDLKVEQVMKFRYARLEARKCLKFSVSSIF